MRGVPKAISDAWGASPRGALGTAADLIAVITAVGTAYVLIVKRPLPEAILAGVVCALALIFLRIAFRLQQLLGESEAKFTRHVADVAAAPLLAKASSHLAQAIVAAGANPSAFELHLQNACQALAEMFGIASGTPCRVTVLQAYAPPGERRPGDSQGKNGATGVAVRLLAASYVSYEPTDETDWVDDNTDFLTLFRKNSPYFLCNNLPEEVGRGYQNSHWKPDNIAEFRAKDSWPYRSTIVWPVKGRPEQPGAGGVLALTGYVCVDAVPIDIFKKDFDVPAGETFAHALYSGLATYRAAQQSEDEGEVVTESEKQ